MGTICENELDKSKECIWQIKVIKSEDMKIMVGIAPKDFDINSSMYDNCGWYYSLSDNSLHSEPKLENKPKEILKSDIKEDIKEEPRLKNRQKEMPIEMPINNNIRNAINKPIFVGHSTNLRLFKTIFPNFLIFFINLFIPFPSGIKFMLRSIDLHLLIVSFK